MSTALRRSSIHGQSPPPLGLENGERTDRRTFHAWYRTTPEDFKAELVGGEIVVASPLKVEHAEYHAAVLVWLFAYHQATPGTRVRDNATVILGEDCELQPDCALVLDPDRGGKSTVDAEGFAIGPPELVVELAASSGAIDLHRKKDDYERHGIGEYAVVVLRERRVCWFVLREGLFVEMSPATDGVFRSTKFPGLWLNAPALLRLDPAEIVATLQGGLSSAEHAAFVRTANESSLG